MYTPSQLNKRPIFNKHMNYVISYWVPPDTSEQRKEYLRRYFDLQCYTKTQFGASQTIITNLDYEGAIAFPEPEKMIEEYGLFARYFGLGQLIQDGLEFPIAVHDHDTFIRAPLVASDSAILCASKNEYNFSEQLVVYPEISRMPLSALINKFQNYDFHKALSCGYGTEARHEQMYNPEEALANMRPLPFEGIPIESSISLRDLVSFDILGHHSLDAQECECKPIPDSVQAVHGHLNKGAATEALIDWLAQ
jgi:hypothetical protein